MQAITFSNARKDFDALFEKVVSDRAPIAIVRHRGEGAVMIAESEWTSIEALNRRPDYDYCCIGDVE